MLGSVEAFVAALRSTPLLPDDQTSIAITAAHSFTDVQEYAKQLVRLKILSVYQAKKVLSNRMHELVIGSYIVVDKLGEGGMGKVYKAMQTRMKRYVALKVVKASLLKNEIALKRFQREMKAASSLTHPNIVRVFDADQIGDRYFLAMEYIEGPDLSKLVKEGGPLDIGTACSITRQAALGLQHAHDMSIVHRDIKPSNILVSMGVSGSVGPNSQAKLLDMGLARAMAQEDDGLSVTELTRAGTVVGTPDYMSPEQAKNSSLVDGRSDLYSLGCTLFYLVTGEVVFPNGNALEKLMSHQMDAPRSSQLIRFDVPTEVDQIIQTLLSKKPSERFQSGTALAHALEPFCRGKNTSIPATVLVAEAVEGGSSATINTSAPARDPFDFRSSGTVATGNGPPPPPVTPKTTGRTKIRPSTFREGLDKTLPPPAPTPTPPPPPSKSANHRTPPPRKKSKAIWVLLALGTMFLFGVVLLVAIAANHDKNKEKDQKGPVETDPINNVPPKDDKKDPPKKDLARENLELPQRYCPDVATAVIAIDFKKMANGSGSKYILPQFKENLADFSKIADMDLAVAIERLTIVMTPTKGKDGKDLKDSPPLIIAQGQHFVNSDSRRRFASLPGVTQETIVPGNTTNGVLYKTGDTPETEQYMALFENPSVAVLSRNRDFVVEAIHKKIGARSTKFVDDSLTASLNRGTSKLVNFDILAAFGVRHSWGIIDPREFGLDTLFVAMRFEDRGLQFDFHSNGTELGLSKFTKELSNRLRFVSGFVKGPENRVLSSITEILDRAWLIDGKGFTPKNQHLRFMLPNDKVETFLEPFLKGSGK